MKRWKKIPIGGALIRSVDKNSGKSPGSRVSPLRLCLGHASAVRTTPRDRVGTAQRTPACCLSLRRDTTDVWPPSSGPKGETEARLGGVLSRCKRMEQMPCPAGATLWESRMAAGKRFYTSRAVFLASLEECQGCCLREHCLRPGAKGNRARRKSAVRRLLPVPATLLPEPCVLQATRWRDVAGRALRRTWRARLSQAICGSASSG
jgi:hypothetical protein